MDIIDLTGTDVVFGSEGVTTVGQCVSGSLKKTEVAKVLKNNNGGTRGKIIYEIQYAGQAEVVVDATTVNPDIGDAITLGGVSMFVKDVEEKWAEEDIKKLAVSAETTQTMIDGAAQQAAAKPAIEPMAQEAVNA